jgi:FolB domain-containing protein
MVEGTWYSMDKIIIKDLLVRGIIGVNDWEREHPQDILINIEIEADLKKAGENDNIEDSVNYRTVSKKVIAHTEKAKRLTVEALAGDIAKICVAERGVVSARVRVEKPGAVRFAGSVGVEIERRREEK